ncbi:ribosomal protein S5-alanine N-acetyltransferase [Microbacterium gilvum]|uniref:Ribosomal protein S5-alanine N-acetyltransferase n=1 Tax=Microbacterium gilvum TaxID=1336204 RepID=A0ABP8ZVI0_9MICO
MTGAHDLGGGILLRPLRVDDASALAAAYTRNRAHLAPWEPERSERFFTSEGQHDEVRGALASRTSGTSEPLVLVGSRGIVGRLNISSITRGVFQSATLGYWVDAALQGRGVMTRAVAAVVGIARVELSLHRLEAGTLVHNTASQAVLRANGFVEYGRAERYLRIAGRWQDHVLFQRILED